MHTFTLLIICTAIGGLVGLVGGILLLSKRFTTASITTFATPFAAGALLSAAFLDLLPEASELGDPHTVFVATLGGIVFFFILERFLRWFHHHHEHKGDDSTDPRIPLIIIGDTIHNMLDGAAIAAAFLVHPSTGIIVTLAVAAHEIPQEIGDFALLLKKGMTRRKVLIVNIVSAFATTISAMAFYIYGSIFSLDISVFLGLVAGFFIYIAVSDIIPSIHENEAKKIIGTQTIMLLVGVLVVGIVTSALHAIA